MAEAEREWPAHFPADCPPKNAAPISQPVFRFVESDPPIPADFESYLEKGIGEGQPDCLRAALSCFLDKNYPIELRRVSKLWRRHHIATASLTAQDGVIKQTGKKPEHYSLWLRAAALSNATKLFSVAA